MTKKILFFLTFTAMAAALSGCGHKDTVGQNKSVPGVTDSEILIGSSLPLSGLISFLGSEYSIGMRAYLSSVNDEGGVYGRKLVLKQYDDGYVPARAIVNTQKLIEQDNVFALLNYVGSAPAIKSKILVDAAAVPILGILSGTQELRDPFDKNVFNVRPSYYEETEGFIRAAVDEMGLKRIAVFYQNDHFGLDGLSGVRESLQKRSLDVEIAASYQRGSLDIEDAVEVISESKAQVVALIATYEQAAKFIKLCREKKFSPLFLALSVVGTEQLSGELEEDGNGVIITQVTPPPIDVHDQLYDSTSVDAINSYARNLAKYFPGQKATFGGLEGYINAQIFVEGLRRAGVDLNRESFVEALESIKNFDVGIGNPVTFGPQKHQGMDKIFLTYLINGRFYEFDNAASYETAVYQVSVTSTVSQVTSTIE